MIVCSSHAKVGHRQAIYTKSPSQIDWGFFIFASSHFIYLKK